MQKKPSLHESRHLIIVYLRIFFFRKNSPYEWSNYIRDRIKAVYLGDWENREYNKLRETFNRVREDPARAGSLGIGEAADDSPPFSQVAV